ncbi:Bug family tripartite tricarboxylate transporter substrate binding protein [Hydrogenophaga sp. BPS33]|uniref:Bug family tripartite tricarboxylate transporter substrate binding protein n=1 Tax=Hydrogenophaga sp. BPS33 TaxID=2651974 RepID=UPI0013599F2C|nr:tripartite tricarboxylate transporter substrate binding protein [Hydrogenophaga sp. BPS33]
MTYPLHTPTATRRTLLRAMAAGLAASTGLPAQAQGQSLLKVVVGSPPGALGDVIARLVAQKLGEQTGMANMVDNKAGASGAIAADAVAKSAGDGHTLLVAPDAVMVVNPFVFSKLSYDPTRDFRSVALLGKATLVLLVSPALKVKTLPEFVALVKSRPKEVNFGTGGPGHPSHMAMELVANRLGLQMTHVPYKGTSLALQGLMGGEVSAVIVSMAEAMPQVKAGNVVPIATSGPAAKEVFPDLPEFKQSHPDLDIAVWFGLFASAATPPERVARLNAEVNKMLAQPDVKKRLGEFGLTASNSAPAELDQLMVADRARFGPLVKALGLTAN